MTAPLHGYRDTDDYWDRASAKHVLHDITVPTLVLNARNDPFLPGDLPAGQRGAQRHARLPRARRPRRLRRRRPARPARLAAAPPDPFPRRRSGRARAGAGRTVAKLAPMDDIVKQAMAKWPNVPDCYGWLALDARGAWRMRDERAQHLNPPGDKVTQAALLGFINRNYCADARGCWYFQNGPQRVYLNLEATPYIARTDPQQGLVLHTGEAFGPLERALHDRGGRTDRRRRRQGRPGRRPRRGAADGCARTRWRRRPATRR